MDIIMIGSDAGTLTGLRTMIKSIIPDSIIKIRSFDGSGPAIADSELIGADVAVIDVSSIGDKGIGLARSISDCGERVNILLIVSDNKYDMASFEVRASGLIRKPVTWDKIRFEFSDLRYPVK